MSPTSSTGRTNLLHHRFWTLVVFLAAIAFWVVGIGAGWRGWLLVDNDGVSRGIVAHAQAFGVEAYVWWIPAAVLTLTTWVVSFGVAHIDHLLLPQGPSALVPPLPTGVGSEPATESESATESELATES